MKLSKLTIPAAALTIATALSIPAMSAQTVSAATPPSSSASSSASSSGSCRNHPGHRHGGEREAMGVLAGLTGTDVKTLTERYPQKTAWQIARQMGKLDALKQAFLARHKQMLDKLAADGKITADDSAKMYADLQKRVAAIDGSGTVILGRPGYHPQHR